MTGGYLSQEMGGGLSEEVTFEPRPGSQKEPASGRWLGAGRCSRQREPRAEAWRQFCLVLCRFSSPTLQCSCEHQTQGQVNKAASPE